MNRPRVTITTRRVTRLSLSRDEYFFSRSRISSLAACPHRARVVRLGSFDPRARPPSGARDRNCVEFARSRRARDGSTSTTTRNGVGSFYARRSMTHGLARSRARVSDGRVVTTAAVIIASSRRRPTDHLGSSRGRDARARRATRRVRERTNERADERMKEEEWMTIVLH